MNVTDACRFSERRRGKPRLMKVAFETVDQKVKVLRAKMALKGHPIFDRVYLRSSKSHTERLLELNAKTILSELPNGIKGSEESSMLSILEIKQVAQRATIAHLRASMSLYLLQICKKQLFTIPTRILSMMMCIQNLVSFCPLFSRY